VTLGVFVTANPVLVSVTVDPVTLVLETRTVGVPVSATLTVPAIDTGTVLTMTTVDPVTLNDEFETVTFAIEIVELAVVYSGLLTVPISVPALLRRLMCCARYGVMRNAAVVVEAMGGNVSE
jgi:hypothetical protein